MTAKTPDDAALLAMAREHFEIYMAVVHKTDAPEVMDGVALAAAHHRQMIELLMDPAREVLLICPRGAGKTFLIQAWHEWQLGRSSESGDKHWANRHRILYVSATATLAYKVSNAIRATIESNETFQAVFPNVKPHPKKWGEEAWNIKGNTTKDYNFEAFGIDGSALGARSDFLTLDDVGNKKNMSTPYQRQVVKDGLDDVIMPTLKPGGRVIMLCTRWAWDDTAHWAQQEQEFKTITMKALLGDAETGYSSYWPERFTVENLLEKRRRNPKSFARQYQNEVVPDEGLVFVNDWFPRFDWLPGEVRFRLCSWDTASSQGRNRSYSAGWTMLVTPDWHIYLARLVRGQVLYPQLKAGIRHQANEDKADFVIIEGKSSGQQVIQEYALESNPWRVIEWQPFGQKGSPTRLEANEKISAMCERGMVHLPSEFFMRKVGGDSWLLDAEKELFSYPDGESDDIVDAMCQGLYWIQGQQQEWERRLRNRQPQTLGWQTDRSPEWRKAAV